MALWQVLEDLFADPTTVQETSLGVREAPLQVGDDTVICRLPSEVVRVLKTKLLVGTACMGMRSQL
jgi:hypothetical protein